MENILDLVATKPWVDMGHGSLFGPGMKLSLVKAYGAPKGSIKVAFSVTTDSQGNPGTAVDFEAGPLDGLYSSASGDIFYAEPYGPGILPNWLWFEETDLGLDPGTWINGSSTDLADLADNLNALDSIGESPTTLGADSPDASGTLRLLSLSPNPMRSQTSIRFALEKPTDVVVTVHDALGRLVSTVERTHLEAGWHERTWRGETDYGSHASAGVYFVRLSASGEERVQKLVLFR